MDQTQTVSGNNQTLPRVWVVEDDGYTLLICTRLLEKNGFSVRGFSSAEELLEHSPDADAEILLTDMHLPGMKGIELCQKMKQQRTMKVIALTGNAEEREQFLDYGFDDVLLKPVSEETLLNALLPERTRGDLSFPLLEQLIDDPEERTAILHGFYSDTENDLRMLHTAFDEQDADTAELVAHRLSGRFAQLDQPELAALLRALEDSLHAGEKTDNLEPELDAADRAVRIFLERLRSQI